MWYCLMKPLNQKHSRFADQSWTLPLADEKTPPKTSKECQWKAKNHANNDINFFLQGKDKDIHFVID